MIDNATRSALLAAAQSQGESGLLTATLALPRIERHEVNAERVLTRLTRLGAVATSRVERLSAAGAREQVEALNTLLFEEEGFHGNTEQYDDPRNSFIDEVLERRTGIPISLAVVYMEVARRAGVLVEGVNFPGHFLLRVPASRRDGEPRDLIVDPFHGGRLLSEADCRQLLRRHLGDDAAYDPKLLAPASTRQIVVRMLTNLKRLYVSMRSFPQARAAVDLIVLLDPLALGELRDRGLLAYHLRDFTAALRDLEAYLRSSSLTGGGAEDEEAAEDYRQIWEHVKTLRRRVAGFN